MRTRQIGVALALAVLGAANLVLAGPPGSPPPQLPPGYLSPFVKDLLCQYLGWFCS
jgi:hypothetical protein